MTDPVRTAAMALIQAEDDHAAWCVVAQRKHLENMERWRQNPTWSMQERIPDPEREAIIERLNAAKSTLHTALALPVEQPAGPPTDAVRDVLAERKRQIEVERWSPEHDDEHDSGELARAAAAYAYPELVALQNVCVWPWGPDWWKPGTPRQMLIKAGALILAEIERLDRASPSPTEPADQPKEMK